MRNLPRSSVRASGRRQSTCNLYAAAEALQTTGSALAFSFGVSPPKPFGILPMRPPAPLSLTPVRVPFIAGSWSARHARIPVPSHRTVFGPAHLCQEKRE